MATTHATVVKKTPTKVTPVKANISAKPSATVKPRAAVSVKTAAPKVQVQVKAPVQVKVQTKEEETQPPVEEVVETQSNESGSQKIQVKPKKKRQRTKTRSFAEIYQSIAADISAAYKHLQDANRALKSLETAHNREVHNTKSRESSTRTPTIVFDQALVDYFRSRLSPEELVVHHKEGADGAKVAVPLPDLSTETRVHRTDVTQLYNLVFKKHNMQDPKDGRNILYQNDPELVELLTTGDYDKEKLEEEVQQIRDGDFRLTIFTIQRFTNHHLGRVPLPPKSKREEEAPVAEETVEETA